MIFPIHTVICAGKHGHEKSMDKWEATGVYHVRTWPEIEKAGAAKYRQFAFRKAYDSHNQQYRVDAFPISPTDEHEFPFDHEGPGTPMGKEPLGPFVAIALQVIILTTIVYQVIFDRTSCT